jgi:hypothetical protein
VKETNNKAKSADKNLQKPGSHAKYMGLFLIIGSLTLLALWFNYDLLPSLNKQTTIKKLKSSQKKSGLQKLWEDDIKKMLEEKIFDNGISSVRIVRVFMLDENLHSQFKHLKAPFKQKKDGQNLLEVSFMSHHSDIEKAEKLIVQYNLTDKDSGNMFWEHSRTINIPDEMLAE